jgi:Enoyl-CoA hydratase/isomerase
MTPGQWHGRVEERRPRLFHLPCRCDADQRVPRRGRETDRRGIDRSPLSLSEREPARQHGPVDGRVRGAGSERVPACDMRFAARESAIFGQFEPSLGVIPGGGATQHFTRLMGRARVLEVMLSAEDYDADLAERYGWINRALPADALGDFVASLARRIASFPAAGRAVVKDRVNAIALAPVEDFRCDSDLFGEGVPRGPEADRRRARARPPDPGRGDGPGARTR